MNSFCSAKLVDYLHSCPVSESNFMQWKTGAAKILPPKPTRFSHVRSNIPQIVRESNPAHNRIAY